MITLISQTAPSVQRSFNPTQFDFLALAAKSILILSNLRLNLHNQRNHFNQINQRFDSCRI
jgi:hypothetical protein